MNGTFSLSRGPLDACWNRLERAAEHRAVLAHVWNGHVGNHPYDFALVHQGDAAHILQVRENPPMPAAFALELGEWFYNVRA